MFSKLVIKGLRGFSNEGTLKLSLPNGNQGSGLTVLVGPNNAGKSTIIEAFKALNGAKSYRKPSFNEGQRNKVAKDKVEIKLYDENSNSIILKTASQGGSETEVVENGLIATAISIFVVKSRRTFQPYFSKNTWDRDLFLQNDLFQGQRGGMYENFSHRLFNIINNPQNFNSILSKVISPLPNWTIDKSENSEYYVKFNYDNHYHSSDGAGEGLLSIFTIVDALYDSNEGDIIVIDEPELSLHPSLQRKLCKLLVEYASDRQIVISTHSPYFVGWDSLINGGSLARVIKKNNGSEINQLEKKQINSIETLLGNLFNPHTLGTDAKEIFFLEDNLIIVEGQEDVIYIQKLLELLGISFNGSFFGWGIGGANNLEKILDILSKLGYEKISIILDKNMEKLVNEYSSSYPNYLFKVIPANDIRDKDAQKVREAVEGLMDKSGKAIKKKFIKETKEIINNVKYYHSTE